MDKVPAPDIDSREFQDILNEACALVPFYTPEWNASGENTPGTALLKIFTHMMETSIRRLNKAPGKAPARRG